MTVQPEQSPRLVALDWLRGMVVLVMVECHVFNAVLAPSYRETSWFGFLNWLNGFVAPAFLLISGGVIAINLQNRWQDVISFGAAWRKLWLRIGQIFIVAYLLYLPTPLVWQFFGPRGPHLIALWTKMDILQCVAGSLSLIVLLAALVRDARVHRLVCVALGIGAVAGVDFVTRWITASALPHPLLNYLGPTGVGLFPLLPWAAFPLFGVWLGPAIFNCSRSVSFGPPAAHAAATGQHPRMEQSLRAAAAGVVFLLVAHCVPSNGWYDGVFVFGRMGWVLLGLAVCCWFGKPARGTRWILEFGQLSLWSYTVHLLIVYSILGRLLGPRLSLPVVLLVMAVVLWVTAMVVRWRAKSLQRQAALRMMPAK